PIRGADSDGEAHVDVISTACLKREGSVSRLRYQLEFHRLAPRPCADRIVPREGLTQYPSAPHRRDARLARSIGRALGPSRVSFFRVEPKGAAVALFAPRSQLQRIRSCSPLRRQQSLDACGGSRA